MKEGNLFRTVLRIALFICTPLMLVLGNLYLLATPAFVRYEYGKPGFPPSDIYQPSERLALAEASVYYLRSAEASDYMANLELAGRKVYNAREVRHMEDVKAVMGAAFWIQAVSMIVVLAAVASARTKPALQADFLLAAYSGCASFVAFLVGVGVMALLSFDVFFTLFHRVLFRGDTWLFFYTDTLIQLFPVPFWVDATFALALLAVAECAVVGGVAWLLARRDRTAP